MVVRDGPVLDNLFHRLADNPRAFHLLRKLPEWNFSQTKKRVREAHERLGKPAVLDIGCGTGEYAHLFDPSAYHGADINPRYLAFARHRRPGYSFEEADMTRWSSSARFGLVLVNGVLHHLPDDLADAVLAVAGAHLTPEGRLLIIEDVHAADDPLLTRLLHTMDEGNHIREVATWGQFFAERVEIERAERYFSGICPYYLVEGRPKACR